MSGWQNLFNSVTSGSFVLTLLTFTASVHRHTPECLPFIPVGNVLHEKEHTYGTWEGHGLKGKHKKNSAVSHMSNGYRCVLHNRSSPRCMYTDKM